MHRFATPRGDVTISARAISAGTARSLEQAGIVLLMILSALLVGRLHRRERAARPERAQAAAPLVTGLTLLGALSLLTGVFPIAGLVALIAALVLRSCRRADVPAAPCAGGDEPAT